MGQYAGQAVRGNLETQMFAALSLKQQGKLTYI